MSGVNPLYGCEPAHTTYCGLKSITTRISKAFGGAVVYFMIRMSAAKLTTTVKTTTPQNHNTSQTVVEAMIQSDRAMDCGSRGSSSSISVPRRVARHRKIAPAGRAWRS
jgi:hypothetical protein